MSLVTAQLPTDPEALRAPIAVPAWPGSAITEVQMMKSPYAGMTVNERLIAAGRLAEWDGAVRTRDRSKMIKILESVDMGEQSSATVDRFLANPTLYGFEESPEGLRPKQQ